MITKDTRLEKEIEAYSDRIRNAKEIIKTVDPSILPACKRKLNWMCTRRKVLIYGLKIQKKVEENILNRDEVIRDLAVSYSMYRKTLPEEQQNCFLFTERVTASTAARKALMEAYYSFEDSYDFDDIETFYSDSIRWLFCIVNYLLEISAFMNGVKLKQ